MFHVIDDDEMIRTMLAGMLCKAGYSVRSFSSGMNILNI